MLSASAALPKNGAELTELVGNRIGRVLRHAGPAQNVVDHILATQGKMLRAQLVFLTSSLWKESNLAHVLDVAAGVELVHRASLIHDDIVDDGIMRRGRPATYRVFGTKEAVLAGDYLFAAAYTLFARADEHGQIIDIMSAAIREMSVGEINELLQPTRSSQEYWVYIRRKTASLLEACCQVGAILGGQDQHWERKLREFGEAVGYAFQLTDDVLDYRGSSQKLGKEVGGDFTAETWTLPIILARDRALLSDSWNSLGFSHVQQVLTDNGILDEVWQCAADYLRRAHAILDELPQNSVVEQLRQLVDAIAVRQT